MIVVGTKSLTQAHFYGIVYKPFQVLSQFSAPAGKASLKDVFAVPPDVYPVGRLDYDSEGLLILTNDTHLNFRLLHPRFAHEREYWVQVEGEIGQAAMMKLLSGVQINSNTKTFRCKATSVKHLPDDLKIPERIPPIRFRKSVPTSWISMVLLEGKNRQVRKMTAAVGHPTLRLIRYRIEAICLQGLKPGELKIMSKNKIYEALFANSPARAKRGGQPSSP